jgi:hypothetical protein
MLATRLDRLPGIALFQIIQTAPIELSGRLQPAPGADPDTIWARCTASSPTCSPTTG